MLGKNEVDLMPKNDYAHRIQIRKQLERELQMAATRRWFLDLTVIALGRLGWGEQRLRRFRETIDTVAADYADLWQADFKADPTNVFAKKKMDDEMRQFCGETFTPYDERWAEVYKLSKMLEGMERK